MQRRYPRFTDRRIQDAHWDDCFAGGVYEAGREMARLISDPPELSWEDVFEVEYELDDQDD